MPRDESHEDALQTGREDLRRYAHELDQSLGFVWRDGEDLATSAMRSWFGERTQINLRMKTPYQKTVTFSIEVVGLQDTHVYYRIENVERLLLLDFHRVRDCFNRVEVRG